MVLHKYLLLTLVLFFTTTVSFSQSKKIQKATEAFDLQQFYTSSGLYSSLIKEDSLDPQLYPDVYRNAAFSAIQIKKYTEAKLFYQKLSKTDQFTFEDAYRYIQLMVYIGDIQNARKMYEHPVVTASNDSRLNMLEVYFSGTYLEELQKDSTRFKVELATFNSEKGDYTPAYYPKGIASTSTQKKKNPTPWLIENLTMLPAYLYHDSLEGRKKLKGNGVHKFSGVAFYDSIDKLWYYSKYLPITNKQATNSVGIFVYDEKRKKERKFSYNEKNAFTSHPNVSTDHQLFWFSSDREGGIGGKDIWYCLREQNRWSEPINAGPQINTPGDELFPFESDGKLYFTSNGHIGFGGYDIYFAILNGSEVASVKNAGYPINTNANDYSIALDKTHLHGYFTSNRGDLKDRLYSVSLNDVVIDLEAYVLSNVGNHNVISGVRVLVMNSKNRVVDTLFTDENGKFSFKSKPDQQYTFLIGSGDHEPLAVDFNTFGIKQSELVEKNFTLEEKMVSFDLNVSDHESSYPVAAATVELKNIETGKNIDFTTDFYGNIHANLPFNISYQITATKLGYDPSVKQFKTSDTLKEIKETIAIRKTPALITMRLENILYAYNSYGLSNEGKSELDTLASFLNENPEVKMEISSHTDSRGKATYNMDLSKKRSESCLNYIVAKGVSRDRLTVTNYGETKLLNQCADGVECSEELHRINRRTEFTFTFPGIEEKNEQ
jgi:outer membrane protein OmpA-like peptidoglycan-associated protein